VLAWVLRTCDAIYRFLASLKLAVISLATLAGVLAYATFFEKWYGTAAVQEWVYRSKGFAILLAFLGMNILCAALIRFPWKRRQIGFVITHAGLLILLAGSWRSVQTADEGQLGMLEGETQSQLVRLDYPVVRVRKLDPHTGAPLHPEYVFDDFRPGNFAWGPGHPRPRGILGGVAHSVASLVSGASGSEVEVLASTPADPFRLVVKSYIPTSVEVKIGVADPSAGPIAKIRPRFKGPGMPQARDVLTGDEQWFVPDRRFYRATRTESPAQFSFLYVDRPELVAQFLNPPKQSGKEGVARFHYQDRSGQSRDHELRLDGQAGKPVVLPESDLTVTFEGISQFDPRELGLAGRLGDAEIPFAQFRVRKGDGPEVLHYGWATLPMFPSVIPSQGGDDGAPQRALVAIDYYLPPVVDPKTNGLFGVIEVMGTPQGSLYYRVFGRGEQGLGEIRSVGPLTKGKEIAAFGGNPNQPMSLSFEVDEYLPAGRTKKAAEPIVLPKGQMGEGIPAALAEMTVDGHTEQVWIRRSPTLEPVFQHVSFPSGDYEVSFDVDRKNLGFTLRLDDFDVGFEPGTEQATRFVSQVRLTDEAEDIHDQPHTIAMNEPLTHRGYTFYQSNYIRHQDPKTGELDGQFESVFAVATDPGRNTKYFGVFMVVVGAFVQFYMRAGVFTRGGPVAQTLGGLLPRKRLLANGQSPGSGVVVVTESEEAL
jgi:hypothetical protein